MSGVYGDVDRLATNILNLPYREPYGLPLRWKDDRSLTLPLAVEQFLHGRGNAGAIVLVHAYLCYYVSAPCWASVDPEVSRRLIRRWAEEPVTRRGCENLVRACLNEGLNPL